MNSGEDLSLSLALCCVVFTPFILQTVGLFTPHWASNSNCDTVGLVYSCCSGQNNSTCENTKGGDELDVRVLGLEATAFAVMLLAVILAVWGVWYESCQNDEEEFSTWPGVMGCCLLLLLIAGLFSFIGCMIIVGNYSISQLGWSFHLCLVSGCFVFLLAIGICLWVFKGMREEKPVTVKRTNIDISTKTLCQI
ncbi:uncharacterized protein LOC123536493 [Mercenaria mercenaria]|uniref:uncharacterized protein LOC123536493 n=1 Tax=Mercenaria mercenaria TaxID=6596 RepID=UPI00234F9189|nr:uncharacterized protein LOC123536493 [Mercenaria mercenaria]